MDDSDALPPVLAKTKIIATVGPACESAELLRALAQAGVSVFRLNFAHGAHAWHEAMLARIRAVSAEIERPLAVLQDLGGPKFRLGPLLGDRVECGLDELFHFVPDPRGESPRELTCATYRMLPRDLRVGDPVLLADGTVALRVVDKPSADEAVCRVEQAGLIRTGQGINLPGSAIALSALTDKDRRDLQWGQAHGVDFVGMSFVRRPGDVAELRRALRAHGSPARVVAKIEKPEAVDHLDAIIAATDAVMVARGDLGVEMDVARVPAAQKQIISWCNQASVPVITATQMLDSMQRSRTPTRAEATDVANAVLDGTDAVMLSGETAVGQYPVEAVRMMNRIACEAEQLPRPAAGPRAAAVRLVGVDEVTEAVVDGAGRVAEYLHARLIIVATRTGQTALAVSKQRNATPTLGISDQEATVRRMCLHWGVIPLQSPYLADNKQLLESVLSWARPRGLVSRGDRVVFLASGSTNPTGHDMILVHDVTTS